jgi:hypothetical protein
MSLDYSVVTTIGGGFFAGILSNELLRGKSNHNVNK